METFYTSERSVWRQYLAEHFETSSEIWFVFPMKGSGEPALSYNDAVEEALCFGWIDSTVKHTDALHRAQRFTPRRKGSPYSQPNIERLIWLDENGLIHPAVRESILPVIRAPFVFPPDIMEALREDPAVWENYEQFSEPYRRIRVAYIEAARKRPEEFQKRLNSFLKKTRDGKLIMGYGGIEKYYRRAIADELQLTVPRREDGWFYVKMMSDPATMAYNAPWFPPDGCIPEPEKEWLRLQDAWIGREPERFYAFLQRRSDGAFVGDVNYHFDPKQERYEMGIVIFAPERGKGYGHEGLRLLLERAFRTDGIACLHNEFETTRDAGYRIHKAAGFRETGIIDGIVQLELTREEYLRDNNFAQDKL